MPAETGNVGRDGITHLIEVGVGAAGQEAVELHQQLKVDIVGLESAWKVSNYPSHAFRHLPSSGWPVKKEHNREGLTHLRRLSVSTTGVVGVQVDTFIVQSRKSAYLVQYTHIGFQCASTEAGIPEDAACDYSRNPRIPRIAHMPLVYDILHRNNIPILPATRW